MFVSESYKTESYQIDIKKETFKAAIFLSFDLPVGENIL